MFVAWAQALGSVLAEMGRAGRELVQHVGAPDPPNAPPLPPPCPAVTGYPTDMTDAAWRGVRPLVETAQTGRGPRRRVNLRAIWRSRL